MVLIIRGDAGDWWRLWPDHRWDILRDWYEQCQWSGFPGCIIAFGSKSKLVLEMGGLGAGKTDSGMGHQTLRPDLVSLLMIGLIGGNDRLCYEKSGGLSLGLPYHGGDSDGMASVHCNSERCFNLKGFFWYLYSFQMDS